MTALFGKIPINLMASRIGIRLSGQIMQADRNISKLKGWGIAVLVIVIGLLFACLAAPKAEALDNNRVIDESIYYNKNSMSEAQIQEFLESENSYLQSYTVPNDVVIGPSVNVRGWRASAVIYWCAQWNGLNPKVILVTMQKEQSLVTSPTLPLGQYSLDWAMGYAVPENSERNYAFQGFAMQVAWGSLCLKNRSDWAISHNPNNALFNTYWVGYTINIDGQSVYLSNGPTAALYAYTPHIQTSFARIYTQFFGSLIKEGFYLVADASNPTGVYMVEENIKRAVPGDIYNSWGLAAYPIDFIDSTHFNAYATGENLTKLVESEGHVYFVDRGGKRGIPDPGIFAIWGFDWDDVTDVSRVTRDYLPTATNLSFLAQLEGSGTVYLVDNKTRHPLLYPELLQHFGYPSQRDVSLVSNDYALTLGSNIASFTVKGSSSAKYVMGDGNKRLIPNDTILNLWNLGGSPFTVLADSTISGFGTGPDLSAVGQTYGQGGVYFLDGGQRRPIVDYNTFCNWGFDQYSIFKVSSQMTNSFAPGENLTLLASHAGGVYLVQNNTFRPIFDGNTFNIFKDNWNLGWADIKPMSDSVYASKGPGSLITFPRLVTYSNGGTVYYMDNDGKRPIQNAFTFNQWAFDWNSIFYTNNNAFLAGYPSPAPLSVLALEKKADGTYGGVSLISSGVRYPIASAEVFNAHAAIDPLFSWSNIYPVSTDTLNTLELGAVIST